MLEKVMKTFEFEAYLGRKRPFMERLYKKTPVSDRQMTRLDVKIDAL